jgi:subtilisin family serine protease
VAAALVGKVIGDKGASTTSLLNGLNWALSNGAHVISLSLGMDFPGYAEELVKEGYPASIATSMALTAYRQNMQLFDAFGDMLSRHENAAQGSVIIAAAGNESRCDEDPDFIVNVSPPAAADKFLSVGAVGRTDKGLHVADFSNRGPSLVGPGVDIVSAALGGSLAVMSGTSMACPHVAGAAVLWAQYLNESKKRITHDALRRRILESVIELPGFSESEVGAGLVSVPR